MTNSNRIDVIGHPAVRAVRWPQRVARVRLGAFEQKIGAGNQADDAVCHDIRAQAAVEFPVPKPTGRARPKSQGANQGMTSKKDFKTGEFIVYPAHGVGQIVAIEEQEVAGSTLELFVINFVKDKMTLRVPTAKISAVGMRKLAKQPIVRRALETLKGRARIKRTMWSRRAQEYEAKINSGNIMQIAEVV